MELKNEPDEIELLLLGACESGKSTFPFSEDYDAIVAVEKKCFRLFFFLSGTRVRDKVSL